MWDITTGQCLHVLLGHVAAVRCVQYDGKIVVSGAYDYMVKVKDIIMFYDIPGIKMRSIEFDVCLLGFFNSRLSFRFGILLPRSASIH